MKERLLRVLFIWAGIAAFAFGVMLLMATLTHAQTFPRWPSDQEVRVYTMAGQFTDKEQSRISAAIESWRPLLPAGIALMAAGETAESQLCQGCITLDRKPTSRDKWGMTYAHYIGSRSIYTEISIDPRAGSGDAFQHTVEHEIGHALGLDHRAKSVMSAKPGKIGPSEADAAILRALYAPPLTNRSPSLPVALAGRPAVSMDRVARDEAANKESLKQHGFTRHVLIQTLDLVTGEATGTYERLSKMVLDDQGKLYEKILFKRSNLKDLHITKQDEVDFSGAQMGLINFADYQFTQRDNGAIHVEPISLDGRRFKGDIWLGDKGIVRFMGTTLPEGKERFPVFTSTRVLVGDHLFPSETISEGILHFPKQDIRVRWIVKCSEYRKFGSQVSVKEVEQ